MGRQWEGDGKAMGGQQGVDRTAKGAATERESCMQRQWEDSLYPVYPVDLCNNSFS